jgi:hypothetical protein
MNISAHEIATVILTLPEQEQQEVIDFILFLKFKLSCQQDKQFLKIKNVKTLNKLKAHECYKC